MNYFADLTWKESIKDVIDILIVTYIMYKLILLVRGTRAVQLLKGILFLVLIWALSTWLNLYTLKWLMNQMFTFGVVAVFIIFQPELRRGLEQLGRGKLFGRSAAASDEELTVLIGEIIKSVNYLSRRKIGALVVFERETGLNDYTESGIKMESFVSSELMINIFIPNTPLHDGAVIIQGKQISAAACYLPLSENPFISKELGTRHRAAIGITEVADAICLVVSEETGQVSLAMNGQVVRDIKEESLIAKLYEELRPTSNLSKKECMVNLLEAEGGDVTVDKWFNNNTFAKILALAVSLLLWFMIHLDEVPTTPTISTGISSKIVERTVPVQPYGLDSNAYVLTSLSTDEVRLEIKGQRSMLTSIFTNDDYKVLVDLSQVKDGSNTLPLVPDLPSGVEVVSMEPSMVTVNVEKLGTKAFNVNIVPEGAPSAGYSLGAPVVEPSSPVKVVLPEGQLEAVAKVQGSVSVKDAKEDVVQKKVKLLAYDAEGKVIENAIITPQTVEVRVPVNQPYTKVPLRIKYSGQLPDGLVLSKVEPSVKEVSIYGSEQALAGIQSYDQATLDLTQFTQTGTSTVNVDLTPPSGSEKIEPSSIQIQVTVSPYDEAESTTKVFPNVPIKLSGVENGLEAVLVSPKSGGLNITLTGSPSMLEGLSGDDIQLTGDLSGLGAGTHEIKLEADLPRFAKLDDAANDLSATVKISEKAQDTTTSPGQDPNEGNQTGPDPTPAEVENGQNSTDPADEEPESNTEHQDQSQQGNAASNRGNVNDNANNSSTDSKSGTNP